MTVFLNAHYDAATSGNITTGNEPGLTIVSGTVPTFSSANTRYGVAGALTAANATSLMTQFLPTPATSLHWRTYVQRVALNSVSATFALARDSASANIASLNCNSNGQIALRDGSTAVAISAYTLSVGEWARVEWFVDKGNNTQTLEYFYGGNIEGSMANEVLTGVCTSATSPIYKIAFGLSAAAGGAQFAFDETVLADTRVGPFVAQTYTYKVWDGTTELPTSSVKVWDGTSEVNATIFGVKP